MAKTDVIAGLPAPVARTLMRALHTERPEDDWRSWVPQDTGDLAAVADRLAAAGFIELRFTDAAGRWWRTTTAGNALGQASFNRPITRATAERHLRGVVERARRWNENPAYLLDVDEIVVFGSYLDPAMSELGDLDLAVTHKSRIPDDLPTGQRTKMVMAYTRASGRRFPTFVDELFWPETEMVRTLKNRSPAISIKPQDPRGSLTDRFEVVFRRIVPR